MNLSAQQTQVVVKISLTKSSDPSTFKIVNNAIKELKERGVLSLQATKNYIVTNSQSQKSGCIHQEIFESSGQ